MMMRTRKGEILTELIMETFRLRGALERHGRRLTEPEGQTPARWQVLGATYRDRRTVPQIARRMGLSRQTVQRVADLLVAETLARYDDNPDHRRSPLLLLTTAGERLVERINRAQAVWSNDIADGLALGDLRTTLATVRSLVETLEADM